MDIRLIDKSNGSLIGYITEDDLQFLVDQLEEESSKDVDYFIDAQTIEMFENSGSCSPSLIALLKQAVGSTDGLDIAWERA
jgi:hypothetical protein